MIDWIWHSVAAQIGLGVIVIAACLAVAWFIPPFRRYAIGVAGMVAAAAAIYGKGARDQRKAEQERREKAVKKVQDKYAKIDQREDTDKDVEDRLNRGNF